MTEPALLSICVLATFALALRGGWVIAKKPEKKQGVLMLIASLVLLANILIWAWPVG